MPTIEIKKYQVVLHAGDQTSNLQASITLFDGANNTIGGLSFTDLTPLPPNEVSGSPRAYFPVELYAPVLDLLRNEKPVYLQILNTSDMSLVSHAEPVGDGEGGGSPVLFPFQRSL